VALDLRHRHLTMWYLLLPFLVVATEYGYHLEGLPPEQSWALYVMRGILMVFVFVLLWVYRPRWALGWIGRSLACVRRISERTVWYRRMEEP